MRHLRIVVSILLITVYTVFSIGNIFAQGKDNTIESEIAKEPRSNLSLEEKEKYYDTLLLDEDGRELDQEEFATSEQFDAYYDRHRISKSEVLAKKAMAESFNAAAKTLTGLTVNQNNMLCKLYLGGLNVDVDEDGEKKTECMDDKAIQSIYVNNKDIYVTQHTKKGDVCIRHYNKDHYCTQDSIDYENSEYTIKYTNQMNDALEMQDYMLIKSVGHGTTLTSYTSPNDGEVYFLVCAGKAKTDDSSDNSTTTNKIGRIKYQANAVYTGSDIQRMCNTNYATFYGKQPTGYQSLKSVIANISRDEKYVYMRVKWCVDGKSNILHTVYDLKKFDALLAGASQTTNNLVSFKNNIDAKNACVYSFDQYSSTLPSSDASAGRRTPFSFNVDPTKINILFRYNQGLTITPAGMIYNYTGQDVYKADNNNERVLDTEKSTSPTLTRLNPNNKKIGGYLLDFKLPDSWFTDDEGNVRRATYESEGLQMVTGHIYIGLTMQDGKLNDANQRMAYIFDIPNANLDFSK